VFFGKLLEQVQGPTNRSQCFCLLTEIAEYQALVHEAAGKIPPILGSVWGLFDQPFPKSHCFLLYLDGFGLPIEAAEQVAQVAVSARQILAVGGLRRVLRAQRLEQPDRAAER
jgi:hypothetical protein